MALTLVFGILSFGIDVLVGILVVWHWYLRLLNTVLLVVVNLLLFEAIASSFWILIQAIAS